MEIPYSGFGRVVCCVFATLVLRGSSFVASITLTMALIANSQGASRTWNGGALNDNWSSPANWSGAVGVTGDTLIFASTNRLINTNNVVLSAKGLTFSSGAGAFVLGGAVGFTTIDLAGNIVNNGINTTLQTINLNLVLTANRQFNVNGTARLQVNGVISELSPRTLAINSANSDDGTVILTGNNSYTGATTVSNGVLNIRHGNALGTTAGGATVAAGAALELDGSGGALVIGAEALSLTGTGISNSGALRNISGSNSWAGAVTLTNSTGVHRINSDAGTLSMSGGITEVGNSDNKDLTFGGAGNVTVTGKITANAGDMRVFKDGGGRLTLTGANTYTGTTTVSAGTLLANNTSGSATGTGAVAVAAGAILGGSGMITPTDANGINVSGVLAPGADVSTFGNLTLNLGSTTGVVAMASGSSFEFELGISGTDISASGISDVITLAGASAGDFAFNGNTIDFKNTGANGFYKLFDTSSNAANTWTGLTVNGSGIITGGLGISNLASGHTGRLIMGGSLLGGTAGDIYLQVGSAVVVNPTIPEPSAALLAVIGSISLLRRRRVIPP